MAEYIWRQLEVAIDSILNWGDTGTVAPPTGDVVLIGATDQLLINTTDLVQI